MKNRFLLVLLLGLAVSGQALADDAAILIKQAVLKNLKATESEDLDAIMSTIHSQSPSYTATMQAMQQLLPLYDLKYSILSYSYIAKDNDYAYVRVRQLTEKVSGPAFNNNVIDALQIFKKEGKDWKLWSQANLSIEYR